MDGPDRLAERFEGQRTHLRAVAYRMLGSLSDAEDAVQEAWLRLSRADTSAVENLGGWLTTVIGRVSLDMLRARKSRREDQLEVYVPDPVVSAVDGSDPEYAALLADSVGLALLVVLDALAPAERLAFVLHDMFAVPYAAIGPVLGRSPNTAAQLASRARRRVQDAATPDVDLIRQREVVDAFFAASRAGDFDALVAVLDPDIVLRFDGGAGRTGAGSSRVIYGAAAVAQQSLILAPLSPFLRPARVNGTAGVVVVARGRPVSIMAFVVRGTQIVEINALGDPERLLGLNLAGVSD